MGAGVTVKPSEEDGLPPVHVVVALPDPVRLLQPERLSPHIGRPVPIRGDPQDKVSIHALRSEIVQHTLPVGTELLELSNPRLFLETLNKCLLI